MAKLFKIKLSVDLCVKWGYSNKANAVKLFADFLKHEGIDSEIVINKKIADKENEFSIFQELNLNKKAIYSNIQGKYDSAIYSKNFSFDIFDDIKEALELESKI